MRKSEVECKAKDDAQGQHSETGAFHRQLLLCVQVS